MFDAMRAGLEGSADPSYSSDDVGYENGNLVTLGLPISNGCEFTGATLPKSRMNPLHGAIPRYLAVYWEKVHPLLPIVHRASFENAPEEVLRYAMAAMATQLLDDEEDRVKGGRLHDLAWREVKKVSRPLSIPSRRTKHGLCSIKFCSLTVGVNIDTTVEYPSHAGNFSMRILRPVTRTECRYTTLEVV